MSLTEDFQARVKRVAFLFDFHLDSGSRYFWNGNRPLDVEGVSYLGLTSLTQQVSLKQSTSLRELEASFRFESDYNEFVLLAQNENFQNRRVTIWFASLTEALVFSNREVIISGKLINIDVTIDPRIITTSIDIEGPPKFLKNAVVKNYTKSDQTLINPTDTFFNFITAARVNPPPWGKKQT